MSPEFGKTEAALYFVWATKQSAASEQHADQCTAGLMRGFWETLLARDPSMSSYLST